MRLQTPPPARYETPRDAAERTGLTRDQIYRAVRRGLLKSRRDWCGSRIAVRKADVDRLASA